MIYTPTFFFISLANFFNLSSFCAFVLFPLFITGRGGNQLDIGLIMGVSTLSSVLCRPWISEMVDRLGRRRSCLLGSVLLLLPSLLYLFFVGEGSLPYVPLLIVRVLHGVGFALWLTAAFTFVADIVPNDRLNEGIGMFGISGLTGSAFGPVVAEWVVHRFGFDVLFLAAAAMSAVALLMQWPIPKAAVIEVPRWRTSDGPSFFQVMKGEKVLLSGILAFLFGFGLAASNNFVSPMAYERRLTMISLYYVAYSGAAVSTRVFGARLADSLGEIRIIPPAMLVTGLGLLLLVFAHGNAMLLLSGFMAGAGHGLLYPCLNVLALRDEPAEIRGKITGIFTGSIDAGVFIGSVLLGLIGELAGFRTLFTSAGVALLLGLGILKWRQPLFGPVVADKVPPVPLHAHGHGQEKRGSCGGNHSPEDHIASHGG